MTSSATSPAADRESLLAIGNFDGVHRGHQYLLARVVQEAAERGLQPKVMTFHPHPAEVLGRRTLPVLTRIENKVERLRAISAELQVAVETFDLALAGMSPQQFAEEVLVKRHHVRRVVVGANFRFGKDRTGNLETLQELGSRLGFSAAALPLLSESGAVISSTRIRGLLTEGEVTLAAQLLGRPHELWGEVIAGKQLGRQLGFPTANLGAVAELLPKNGVYACSVTIPSTGQQRLPAVCNIGTRPTLGSERVEVEVHLLAFEGELYGKTVGVALKSRLRDERAFGDLDALREQIALDAQQAAAVLRD